MHKKKNNDLLAKWSPKKMKLSFNSVSVICACMYVCILMNYNMISMYIEFLKTFSFVVQVS